MADENDNVRSLRSIEGGKTDPAPPVRSPLTEDMAKSLEAVLARVRAGEIRSIVLVTLDNKESTASMMLAESPLDVIGLVGGMEAAKFRSLVKIQ